MAISGNGYEMVPATLACQPVGGLHARNQCAGFWQQGVKRHDILTGRRKLPVNVRSRVGVTGGYVVGANADAPTGRKRTHKRKASRHDGMPGGWQEAMRSL